MAGWAAAVSVLVMAAAALPPGSLDPRWGGDGIVTTDLGATWASDVAVLADGRVVVAGGDDLLGAVLARYLPDGRPDRSFSGDGVAYQRVDGRLSQYHAMAVQQDGSVVAAGPIEFDSNRHGEIVVARHLPDGSLDPTFGGGDGTVTATAGSTSVYVAGVAVHGDGRIVVATIAGGGPPTAVFGFTSDGAPDDTFGEAGVVRPGVLPLDVVALADGRTVLAGQAESRPALAALLPDGSLDPGFGDGGIADPDPPGYGGWFVAVAAAGGELVAAGSVELGTADQDDILVARFRDDGTLDPSFGGDGFVTEPLGSGYDDRSTDVGVQPDGRVVVAAHDDGPSTPSPVLLRFRPGGRPDRAFGGTGIVRLDTGRSGVIPVVAMVVGARTATIAAGSRPMTTARVVL